MIFINEETPETVLIEKENKSKVADKFGYSRSRIQQIVPKSLLLIIKRLKENEK